MYAVVPAAGQGTRLRPLTEETPKALVEVAGQPLLSWCFDALLPTPVSEFVVVTGYEGDQIRSYYGSDYEGVPITYTVQAEQRGLADAVATAEEHVEGPFVVLNGDNVLRADLQSLVDAHEGSAATLLVEDVDASVARTSGVCRFDDGRLVGYVEKPDDPPSTTASAGAFVLDPVVFDAIRVITPSERGEYELTDAVDLLLYAGHSVETVALDGWRCNVNTPEDVEAVEDRIAGGER